MKLLFYSVLGLVAFKAFNTVNAIPKIKFSLVGIALNNSYTSLTLQFQVYNPSNVNLRIERGLMDVLINKVKVAEIQIQKPIDIAESFTKINIPIQLSILSLITEAKKLLKKTLSVQVIGTVNIGSFILDINQATILTVPGI